MKVFMILLCGCMSFGLFSCTVTPPNVHSALKEAGNNRAELEKVIEHYKTTGEKQKLEATYFLIANMPGKYAEYYNYNEQAFKLFIKGKDANKDNRIAYEDYLAEQIEMLKDLAGHKPLIVQDIEVISANYLIENIDLAFKIWQEPWATHFSFNEFCEHILPYRIHHEPLSNWRKYLYDKYYWVKDSIKNTSDPVELTLYLNDLVAKDFWTLDELDIPYVAVPLLEQAKGGGCDQRYVLMVSILRAMGIPAMIDYAPQHNNTFKSHSWVVYLDSLHRYRPCDGGRIRGKIFKKDNLQSAFPTDVVIPLADGFGSNVFRYTYAINKNSLAAQTSDKQTIPLFFRNSCIKNVSSQYIFDKHPIIYEASLDARVKENTIAYLSVFGYGSDVREADYSIIQNNKIRFDHIGSGIVYLISTFKNGKLTPFSQPILLRDTLGTMEILNPDTVHKQKMILTRKCKISLQMLGFAEDMIGAKFEGSNNSNFEPSETLFEIKEAPYFMTEIEVKAESPYKYVRYISPHNEIHIAEVLFLGLDRHEGDFIIEGKPIVHIDAESISEEKPEKAFDNNIRTNFNATPGSWVGLKFSSPQLIHKIKYLPRNNFNIIETGNKYELMYYDYKWVSLGVQIATKQYLEYNNAPSHALFLLKNLTQGKEERIFTYENGKQIWW